MESDRWANYCDDALRSGIIAEAAGGLVTDNGLFARRTPMVIAENSHLADNPVARNDIRNRIGGDGAADRPDRVDIANRSGYILIGAKMAGGDSDQRFPDFQLEIGAKKQKPDWLIGVVITTRENILD